MAILAIESTCDETGAAVTKRSGLGVEVLSNIVASSSQMHEKYGGIVPEVAAREQIMSIIPVISVALENAGIAKEELEAVAVAQGPGLVGSLLIGVETAKTLAYFWNKPLIGVNHMAGHVLANWILNEQRKEVPTLPAIGLVVSGGHTDLILVKSLNEWEWLGGTRDDAAGECFDKAARILGLGYPGGPAIEIAAEKVREEKQIFKLPRPLLYEDTYDMSFSGLKAALSREVDRLEGKVSEKEAKLLARELSDAVVEVLATKTMKAAKELNLKSVLLAGGVAASKRLREEIQRQCDKNGIKLFMPEFKYCTDNGAMIGTAAILRPNAMEILSLRPEPGMETV